MLFVDAVGNLEDLGLGEGGAGREDDDRQKGYHQNPCSLHDISPFVG